MKKQKQNKPDVRCATCPRWDRWHIRIPNPEDQQKLIELYRKSGAKTKSDYVRGRLLNQSFKVITEDKSSEPYLRELSSILTKLSIIGVSYNEAVKTLNSYHTVKTAQRMIHQLETCSAAIIRLQVQAIQLTMEFQSRESDILTL
ncbi:hypothetical protein HQ35_09740 [Porphyromonas cangingivalis]|uniref:Mobilization protein n=1 Tax=Porphyromonas cangingivalis TaxID=36874 RepID=A0A0A2ELF1_PORCN|nr:hypothetical protein [Porphyromonas cangingivalis]KGN78492.1 hypothetical protein HQ35_09740 [Porphyromonas cangingivalis]